MGSANFMECMALALDSSGNVVVQGMTPYTNFPTTSGAYQRTNRGPNEDGFVAKFAPDLATLMASTFIGGATGNETGDASARIGFDSSGNIYTGLTTPSTDFPVTSDAFMRTNPGGSESVVLFGLTPDLTGLIYGTYLGGNGTDFNRSFALK